jgi:uncharacterized protein YecT (DUF1311 family)
MRVIIFLGIVIWLAIPAVGQETNCFERPTNLEIDRCLAKRLADAERAVRDTITTTSKALTREERMTLGRAERAWSNHRDLHCRLAGMMFSGGRMQPLEEGACRVRLTKEHLQDIEAIDVSNRSISH